MRISDWSSDVCSSDLLGRQQHVLDAREAVGRQFLDALHHLLGSVLPVGQHDLRSGRPALGLVGGESLWRRAVGENLAGQHARSEEHTSELQSLMRISYAVFCLKKKKITQ